MNLVDVEKSVFSQNGEDGIIEFLLGTLFHPDKTFIEIGCGNGQCNNTTALAIDGYSGTVFDGSWRRIEAYQELARKHKFANEVGAYSRYFGRNRVRDIHELSVSNPDLLSIDIDSIDWYIVAKMLKRGMRPKVICAEYNAAFGQEPLCVVAHDKFYALNVNKLIYFGASVKAWDILLEHYGYKFITVCSAGVNAFYVRREDADMGMVNKLNGLLWSPCPSITEATEMDEKERLASIDMPLVTVSVETEVKATP